VKELTDTVEEVGFHDSVHEVIPVMADLVDDPGALKNQPLFGLAPRVSFHILFVCEGSSLTRQHSVHFVLEVQKGSRERQKCSERSHGYSRAMWTVASVALPTLGVMVDSAIVGTWTVPLLGWLVISLLWPGNV
jgi:hypothetical protein